MTAAAHDATDTRSSQPDLVHDHARFAASIDMPQRCAQWSSIVRAVHRWDGREGSP